MKIISVNRNRKNGGGKKKKNGGKIFTYKFGILLSERAKSHSLPYTMEPERIKESFPQKSYNLILHPSPKILGQALNQTSVRLNQEACTSCLPSSCGTSFHPHKGLLSVITTLDTKRAHGKARVYMYDTVFIFAQLYKPRF